MSRNIVCIACAVVAGTASVYFLPPDWIAAVAGAAAICVVILAVIVRIGTRAQTPANAMASILLLLNLPEQPLAKVKEGWALASFLASAAFLVSLGLSVIVRASTLT